MWQLSQNFRLFSPHRNFKKNFFANKSALGQRTDPDGRTDERTHQPTKLHYKDKVHHVDDCLGSSDAIRITSI